jgi:hypothetical protein
MSCRFACLNNNVVAIALSVVALANAGPSPWLAIPLLANDLSARDSREDDPRHGVLAMRPQPSAALEAAKRLIRETVRYPIALVDPELAPDPDAIGRVDAFVVAEHDGRLRPKIYVNRESALFQRAADGDDFGVKVLAAVLVHEMAHLMGQQEAGAHR